MIIVPGHRVLVRPDRLEESDPHYQRAHKAGLLLPKEHEDLRRAEAAVDRGTIIAIGPTAWKDFGGEAWCKVGDKIAFAKYSGKTVTDNGENYLVLNDEDVVCIIKED